jgi:hypothetical protein
MMLRAMLSFVLCGALLLPAPLQAQPAPEGDRVTRIEPVVRDGQLYIDADVLLGVSPELRDAAERGIPVYFTADLELVSKRWWWFDKTVISRQRTWRVVYNALTRQWRVGAGDLSLPESTFDDAMSQIRNIRGWDVARIDELDYDEVYHGRLRVRLDTSLLARPFQVDALNSQAWALATPWKEFTFSISVDTPR